MRGLWMAAACLALTACPGFGSGTLGSDDPVTWESDVQQIMMNQCVACHGETPTNGAPPGFRLDVYDMTEGNGTPGAFEFRDRIDARSVMLAPSPMPPGNGPPIEDQAKLSTWIMLGAPRTEADIQ